MLAALVALYALFLRRPPAGLPGAAPAATPTRGPSPSTPSSVSRRSALAAAEKAVALDPDLAEAYVARGTIRGVTRWDWAGANADFQRALTLSPESWEVQIGHSRAVLRPLGRVKEGIAVSRKAAALDPLNGQSWTGLASFLIAAGRLKEARDAVNRSLEVNPDHAYAPYWFATIFLLEGQPAAALEAAGRSTLPPGSSPGRGPGAP
jgi:tetratricopeptide (TPR) repeat protein